MALQFNAAKAWEEQRKKEPVRGDKGADTRDAVDLVEGKGVVNPEERPVPQAGPQTDFLKCLSDICVYGGSAGGGKAGRCPDRLADGYDPATETKVLTPFGFKLIGDIKVGAAVCNPDGTICKVIGVYDQGIKQFYRVTLDDGSSVEASEDHLWSVSISGRRKRVKHAPPVVPEGLRPEDEWNLRLMQRTSVVTTLGLASMVDRAAAEKGDDTRAYYPQLPLTAPVVMTAPCGRLGPVMPPYTLGVLIGDGCLTQDTVVFDSPDPEIAARVQAELDGTYALVTYDGPEENCKCYRIRRLADGSNGRDSAQSRLRREGLMGHAANSKFVPPRIKHANIATRLAFLQGLFDTDGYIDERGHIEYTTVSKQLADDVQYLCRSMGMKATISTKEPIYTYKGERLNGQLAYRIYVRGNNQGDLFSLPRKKNRATAFNGGDVWPSHRVVSVERTVQDFARCIRVSHPNSLYITDDFIVTHNTYGLFLESILDVGNPEFRFVYFRREQADISTNGGPWDKSMAFYPRVGAYPNKTTHKWIFPSGAQGQFTGLQYDQDVLGWQTAEIPDFLFDELTHFCMTPDHEVLTEDGWVPINEVNAGTRVASLNDDGGIEYECVTQSMIFQHSGDLITVNQRAGVSFRVTPNHKVVVLSQAQGKKWKFLRADELEKRPFHIKALYDSVEVQPKDVIRENYVGPVHCLTVDKNHNFYVRHNGRCHWTGNSEDQFWYMLSRNRSTSGCRSRVRAGTNPHGGSWVKKLVAPWVDADFQGIPAKSGEERYLAHIKGDYIWVEKNWRAPIEWLGIDNESRAKLSAEALDNLRRPKSVTFIRSSVYDNPILIESDPTYISSLMAQGEVEERRLLHGDWSIMEGAYFSEWNYQRHTISPGAAKTEKWHKWFAGFDYGKSAPSCFLLMCSDEEGNITVVDELYKAGMGEPSQQAYMVKCMIEEWGLPIDSVAIWADPSLFPPSNVSQMLKHPGKYIAEEFWDMGLRFIPANNERINGWARVREYIHSTPPPGGISNGEALYVSRKCKDLVRTIAIVTPDEHEEKDVDTTCEDHACFVAGTLITTDHGDVPIENITIGDMVMTRNGFRRVYDSGMTDEDAEVNTLVLTDGTKLRCTPNHPIHINDKGWVRVDCLVSGDVVAIKNGWNISVEDVFKIAIPQAVYNISVETDHEYFANGILVKNCDSLRYALMSRPRKAKKDVQSERKLLTPEDILKSANEDLQRRLNVRAGLIEKRDERGNIERDADGAIVWTQQGQRHPRQMPFGR